MKPDIDYEEADIHLAERLVWHPWHQWRPGITTWVDGVLRRPEDEFSRPLDIASIFDDKISPVKRLAAEVVWSQGSILTMEVWGVETLVVPAPGVSIATMTEALNRAWNHNVLPQVNRPLPIQ